MFTEYFTLTQEFNKSKFNNNNNNKKHYKQIVRGFLDIYPAPDVENVLYFISFLYIHLPAVCMYIK